mgnify:FL=1
MGFFDKFKKKETKIENEPEHFLYSEEALDRYEAFISEQFGEYEQVFHEIVSPDIHLDIIIVPPTEKNNYYKLITMGMGAYGMNVPDNLREYELERAELVLYLPPTWNIKSEKEEDYWPIQQLKIIARLPIEYNSWVGSGHTISGSEENEPYAENTGFCSIMLINALNSDFGELDLRIEGVGKINFYQLFPLYQEELEYKKEHGANELLEKFSDDDIMPIVNISRKNYGLNTDNDIENELAELYNKLANLIASTCPKNWEEFHYLGEVENGKKSWSSTFYVKEADSENYVKGLDFAAVSDQCINAMDTILLQIYECFMKNDYKPWEQLSLSVKNTGDFDVKYQYDVMEKSEYGQAERETIWAYETFGWKPRNSPFLMNI